MSEWVAQRPAVVARLRDLVALGKPRLSVLVLFTSAIGVWMAGGQLGPLRTLVFLVSTCCLVAAANTLNCWLEKEIDGLMRRTRDRPLPAGRLEPPTALAFGLILGAAALLSLLLATNRLTAILGAIAILSYVLVYTPLKRITPWAVIVGALPGALPPLMGWAAATDRLALPGWFLFGVLFLWQLPHFIAISLYLKEDFRAGGIRVLPLVFGDLTARWLLFLFAVALTGWTLAGQPLGLAGSWYTAVAALSGAMMLVLAGYGLRRDATDSWARKLFGFTLLHLPILIAVLVLDAA